MAKEKNMICSFCGKSAGDNRTLIAGPGCTICDKCVNVCIGILQENGIELESNKKSSDKKIDLVAELGVKPQFKKLQFDRKTGQCFYLCPFCEPFNAIYSDHVKPNIEKSNLSIKRADEIFGTQPIIDDIWQGICESEIIIADLTGKNPNVMYEVGIAHTIGKPVIIITQHLDDVPFDLRQYRCIVYDYSPKGMKLFEDRIYGTLEFIKETPKETSGKKI